MVLNTDKDAIFYLTDCTLATVSSMAMLKKKKKSEYERQIKIAQTGVDFINTNFGLNNVPTGTSLRISKIIFQYEGSVAKWAKTYENS